MKQNGQIILIISFVVVVFLALGIGWFYYQNLNPIKFSNLNLPFMAQKAPTEIADWKKFDYQQKLSYLYPPDWYLLDNTYVTQYPFSPNAKSSDVANAISVSTVTSQLQVSYANEDWFNKIDSAKVDEVVNNDYHPSDQVKVTKVYSNKVRTGQRYVIFKDQFSSNQLTTYILAGNQIYLLRLQNYDDQGLELFKKILSTVEIAK